jgi:hypothetical protein
MFLYLVFLIILSSYIEAQHQKNIFNLHFHVPILDACGHYAFRFVAREIKVLHSCLEIHM